MNHISTFIEHYGALAFGPIMFFEALGAPVPAETGLFIASLSAADGKLSLPVFLISSFIGSSLGNFVSYFIGRWGGHALLLKVGKLFKLKPDYITTIERLMDEKGVYFVFFSRFIVVLRQLNGYLAGATRMKFRKFLYANLLGAAAWILVWGAGPYLVVKLF